MLYNRDELLNYLCTKIWNLEHIPGPLSKLSTRDIVEGDQYCPKCQSWVLNLYRTSKGWGCGDCNEIKIGQGRGKVAKLYRIVNDLLQYFGEPINSAILFDTEAMEGFTRYSGIKSRTSEFTLFVDVLQKLLAREQENLGILTFLTNANMYIVKNKNT